MKRNLINRLKLEQREIRIFVSSTFRDMHEEREELMKNVFPQLKDLCEQRGITLFEVDLRWGIPSEERSESKILSTCLEEIDNCRPFFIGILGERYGWVPEIQKDLLIEKPWLNKELGKSVTEIEILHAILNNPEESKIHSYFYFRDPKYIDSIPEEKKLEFIETSPNLKEKLEKLKQKIRLNRFPLREDYKDPKEFGQLVIKDFMKVIDKMYPAHSNLSLMEKETLYHVSFAKSRSQFYLGGEEYLNSIYAHFKDDDPLIVTGESGLGKSSLLANWYLQYISNTDEKNTFLFVHFIGASASSTNWVEITRRLLEQIKHHFGINEQIPNEAQLLTRILMSWLKKVAKKEKIIIVIDALDQIEKKGNQEDLFWLPSDITKYAKVILSTLPGKSMNVLKERGWLKNLLQIMPLTIEQRKTFIFEYFKQYSKRISGQNLERIAHIEMATNPIFLKTLLNELRIFGKYDELDSLIDNYLQADSIQSLFEKVLKRLEQDYDKQRPQLVKDVMCLIAVSRMGLTENELVDLLDIPTAVWSPLFLATKTSFVNRSGFLDFFHNYFRKAVQTKYLNSQDIEEYYRELLIRYFSKKGLQQRAIEEIPWQLTKIRRWKDLYSQLSNIDFIRQCWKYNPIDTKMYWAELESSSSYTITSAYNEMINSADKYKDSDLTVIFELLKGRYPQEAINLGYVLSRKQRENGKESSLINILIDLADNLRRLGKLEEANKALEESEKISTKLKDYRLYTEARILRGVVSKMLGNVERAFLIYQESEDMCRKHGYEDILAMALFNLADIYVYKGDLAKSLKLFHEAEEIYRKIGDLEFIGNTLNYIGSIQHSLGKETESLEVFKETEEIFKKIGYKNGLPKLYFNLGKLWSDKGQYQKALSYLNESEKCSINLGKYVYQTRSFLEKATIYTNIGDFTKALQYLKKAEKLSKKMGFKEGEALFYSKKGLYFAALNNKQEAIIWFKKYETISKQLGFDDYVKEALELQKGLL